MESLITKIQSILTENTKSLKNIQNHQNKIKNKCDNFGKLLDKCDNQIDEFSKLNLDSLDKFYTNPNIVDICINDISKIYKWENFDSVIEPSAGNGNFFFKIPHKNKYGMDIDPDNDEIIKQDFFTYTPDIKGKIMTLGNPPFGRVSSLAVKFF